MPDERQAEVFDRLRRDAGLTAKAFAGYARKCERQAMRYFTGDCELPVGVVNLVMALHPDPRVADALSDFVNEGCSRVTVKIDGGNCTDLNGDGTTDAADQRHALAEMIREQASVLDTNLDWAELEPRVLNLIRHAHCLYEVSRVASAGAPVRKQARPIRLAGAGA